MSFTPPCDQDTSATLRGVNNVSVGSRLSRIEWLSSPDKYSRPKLFDTIAKARAYDSTSYITAELEVTTPDGGAVQLSGCVPSVDSMSSTPVEEDAIPAPNAAVTSVAGNRLVFTNPDGGRWLLIV
jgi:hypothetical protein